MCICRLLIDPNKSDADCHGASQLFRDLGINTHLKQVKRLGKSSQDKPPLLLVVLPNQQIHQDLLDKAKDLRRSSDTYVSTNIFINPDRTLLERQ